jgi:hypothetical protein
MKLHSTLLLPVILLLYSGSLFSQKNDTVTIDASKVNTAVLKPCWLLSHEGTNNKEVFWISKKTNEVLKLEQEFGGRYRYKIKLGFSV